MKRIQYILLKKLKTIVGEPYKVKAFRTVRVGGKDKDNIKVLPIYIALFWPKTK